MGVDITLFIEQQIDGQWVNPVEIAKLFSGKYSVVEICWWPLEWPQTGLFFGPQAVVKLQPGLPDNLSPELSRRIRPNFEDDSYRNYAGWIAVPDLCLELWPTETVLVENKVEAQLAAVFGTGQRSLAEIKPELEQMGVDLKSKFSNLFATAKLVGQAQDWAILRHHELFQLKSNSLIPVTWRQTMADFAGRIWLNGLARLRNLPSPELYRIVAGIG